jgi:NADH:ubiquinone oxidoreductase subunit F (NADH-binding)
VLAADAIGARDVVVALPDAARVERAAVEAALEERRRSRLDLHARIRVAEVPRGFVAGEETALVRSLNGGPAKPSFTPPRPFERGIGGAPTFVSNVETLAHLALIARFGGDWFRELGTPAEPGSVLTTLSGAVRRPGVYEVALGTRFTDVLGEAGGLTRDVSAFLVGGYFGSWISSDENLALRFLDADLKRHGATLGARAVIALPDNTCALGEVARVARYLASESARQCGPCLRGLDAVATAMARLASGDADERPQLARWVSMIRGRGACRHPDGATGFVASALDVFGAEVDLHLRYGRCRNTTRGVLPVAGGERR